MPKARSGYEALPAHDEQDEQDYAEDDVLAGSHFSEGQTLPRPVVASRRSRSRTLDSAFNVDIRNIDAKLKQWQSTLKQKFAIQKSESDRSRLV